MHIETFRNYCLSKPGVSEHLPFDAHTLVFKVLSKMFALTNMEKHPFTVNLKCDPTKAMDLRADYNEITPGFHMNKKHWNSVLFATGLEDAFLISLIDHSYDLVVAKMTKKERAQLELL